MQQTILVWALCDCILCLRVKRKKMLNSSIRILNKIVNPCSILFPCFRVGIP